MAQPDGSKLVEIYSSSLKFPIEDILLLHQQVETLRLATDGHRVKGDGLQSSANGMLGKLCRDKILVHSFLGQA